MTITIKNLGDAIIYIGAIAVALAAIGVVARFTVLRPLKKWLREQIKPPLDAVQAEMVPDHGTSLRDAVDRVEVAQRELAARFSDHLTNHPGAR